jgi:hypothetical protein
MQIKKIIFILLSLAILFISTSCDKTAIDTISDISVQTEAETEPLIEYKTIEPPEDGWTLELLNEVTYINGKDIDLPFCLNDLGEDFSYGDLQYNYEDSRCLGYVYYKGEQAFRFLSQNFGSEFDDNDEIQYFSLLSNHNLSSLNFDSFITINNYNFNSSYEEMINYLGKYYAESNSCSFHYRIDNHNDAIYLIHEISKKGTPGKLKSIFFNILEE